MNWLCHRTHNAFFSIRKEKKKEKERGRGERERERKREEWERKHLEISSRSLASPSHIAG